MQRGIREHCVEFSVEAQRLPVTNDEVQARVLAPRFGHHVVRRIELERVGSGGRDRLG